MLRRVRRMTPRAMHTFRTRAILLIRPYERRTCSRCATRTSPHTQRVVYTRDELLVVDLIVVAVHRLVEPLIYDQIRRLLIDIHPIVEIVGPVEVVLFIYTEVIALDLALFVLPRQLVGIDLLMEGRTTAPFVTRRGHYADAFRSDPISFARLETRWWGSGSIV